MKLTSWLFVDCRQVECPRCKAGIEAKCTTPKGRECGTPHAVRIQAFVAKLKELTK